jgi:glycosyltransferase involved in cell wall biosynthesis
MKKICVITTAHPAEDNRIYLKEIQTLLKNYEVVYITTSEIKNPSRGLEVINVGHFAGSFKKRIKINWDAFRRALKLDVVSYHFHDFDFIIWAALLRIFKGRPVIYDIHEDYPAVVLSRGYVRNGLIAKILSGLIRLVEIFCSLFFTASIVVNESIRKRISHTISNTIVVANYPRKEFFPKLLPIEKRNQKIMVHLGNLNRIRGAEIIFEALSKSKVSDLNLKVVGEVTPGWYLADLKKRYPGVRATVTGKLPYAEALKESQQGRVGIISYLPLPNHLDASPNKIFEYMGLGLPVVAADLSSFKAVITDDVGITYRSEDPNDLAKKLIILDNPGKLKNFSDKGRELFEAKYNWNNEEQKLLELYEIIIGK